MDHSSLRRVVPLPLAIGLVFAAGPARADGECLDKPNPLIGVGGSASKPMLGKIAPQLLALDEPVTLIYQAPGACFGITTYVDGTKATGTASYWDADGTEQTCNFPVTGVDADFGMLGVQGTPPP